jgi:hypothetical protein
MKNMNFKSLFISTLTCFLITITISVKAQKVKTLTLINPGNRERKDELIVLKRSDIYRELGPGTKFISVASNGKSLPVQFDDLDGNDQWDEALFLYSFKPNEKVSLTITPANVDRTNNHEVQRAHVRLRKKNPDNSWGPLIRNEEMPVRNVPTDISKQPLPPYLTEGPAWENDKVGFRLYFDTRNAIDIWGKRTTRMVLDSVGTKVEPTYHELHYWGMDILHVVKSLGGGSLALLVPLAGNSDTLIRVGGQDVKHTIFTQLSDGLLRAVFNIDYDWQVKGNPVHITHQISIWASQYFYESKVWVKGAPAGTKLVSGIADFYDNIFQAYQKGATNILLSHGKQSENFDNLGMAILVPHKDFSFAASAPHSASDVMNTWLSVQDIKANKPSVFRFVAAWEKSDPRFANLNLFKDYLDTEALKFSEPVKIKW